MVAMFVLAQFCLGLLAVLVQSRRLTEGSLHQASALAIFQGHLNQIRGIGFDALPFSPVSAPAIPVTVPTQLDPTDQTPITLSWGSPPVELPAVGTTPTGAIDNNRTINIKSAANSPNTEMAVNVWLWVTDMSGGIPTAPQAKSITMIYTWQAKDGATIRTFRKAFSTVLSSIPSY